MHKYRGRSRATIPDHDKTRVELPAGGRPPAAILVHGRSAGTCVDHPL